MSRPVRLCSLAAVVAACLLTLMVTARCGPDVARFGTVLVAVSCPEPQRTWIADGVPGLGVLQGPAWRLALAGESVDVTVRCAELPPGALGQYTVGAREVLVDHYRAVDLFAAQAVSRHELVHYYLATHAPHPERARWHVCRLEDVRSDCWPGGRARLALMAPTLSAAGSDVEGPVAQQEPTLADMQMFQEAMQP